MNHEDNDTRESAWRDYLSKMRELDAQNNLAGRGLIPSHRDWHAGWEAATRIGWESAYEEGYEDGIANANSTKSVRDVIEENGGTTPSVQGWA